MSLPDGRSPLHRLARYLRRNWLLAAGAVLLLGIAAYFVVDFVSWRNFERNLIAQGGEWIGSPPTVWDVVRDVLGVTWRVVLLILAAVGRYQAIAVRRDLHALAKRVDCIENQAEKHGGST